MSRWTISSHTTRLSEGVERSTERVFSNLEDAVKKVARVYEGRRRGGGGGDEEDEEDEEDREDDDEDDVRSAIESIHVTVSSHETPQSVD